MVEQATVAHETKSAAMVFKARVRRIKHLLEAPVKGILFGLAWAVLTIVVVGQAVETSLARAAYAREAFIGIGIRTIGVRHALTARVFASASGIFLKAAKVDVEFLATADGVRVIRERIVFEHAYLKVFVVAADAGFTAFAKRVHIGAAMTKAKNSREYSQKMQ